MRLDKAKLVIYLELQYLLLSCICSLDIPQVYFNMYQKIPALEFWEKLWTVLKSPGNEDEILTCTADFKQLHKWVHSGFITVVEPYQLLCYFSHFS